jgi:hypothetical protein
MDGKLVLQPVKISERDGLTVASYTGLNQTNGRPFAALVLSSVSNAWVFFYESVDSSDATFAARAEKLFATVREVKGGNRG